jgi:MoaA/NifB/PqqE/SkfB family radical SAM enzyme
MLSLPFRVSNLTSLIKQTFLHGLKTRPRIPLFQRVVVELQSNCNRSCYFCCRESDVAGKRKTADGQSVVQSMPTEKILGIFDELQSLSFNGYITFHQLSEAFLDKRLIEIASEAKKRDMKPYVHTNGDVLRNNQDLCGKTAAVFEYVVVGLYDYKTPEERDAEKKFWKSRLAGTKVMFSLAEKVYRRTHSPDNKEMLAIEKKTYPTAPCAQPEKYLLIHYNGDVCCCCEDMYGELLRANIFEKSIREIWYSAQHERLILDLRAGNRTKFSLCSKCTMGPSFYAANPMDETNHLDQ